MGMKEAERYHTHGKRLPHTGGPQKGISALRIVPSSVLHLSSLELTELLVRQTRLPVALKRRPSPADSGPFYKPLHAAVGKKLSFTTDSWDTKFPSWPRT